MALEKILDNLHDFISANQRLQIFTAFTRMLLAIGFIPPSIVKILNQPFTVLPDTHPVGHYFNALYQTGFYYQFIGFGQLTAAILLLFPRTAHLGALMFFPIILNIAVLTSSVGFAGTNYITALMLLACIYLICWDYDRLKPLFFASRRIKSNFPKSEFLWLPVLFAVAAAILISFFALFGIANFHKVFPAVILPFSAAGFVFGLACALHHKFMRIGRLEETPHSIQ